MVESLWIALAVLIPLVTAFGAQTFKRHHARLRIIHESRCEPCIALRQQNSFWGLRQIFCEVFDLPIDDGRNNSMKKNFKDLGHTYLGIEYGRSVISTISPQNIQAVYSTNFDSYGVKLSRHAPLRLLLGDGILTNDGALWRHLRTTAAPIITKAQMADLASFDVHVSRLLDLIPRDGSTVDLQPLFDCLSLDSATEFLFGESVDSLALDTPLYAKIFLKAWNEAQRCVDRRIGLPSWKTLFMRDARYQHCCRVAHQFVDNKVQKAMSHCLLPDVEKNRKFSVAHELAKMTKDKTLIRQQLLHIFLPTHDAIGTPLGTIFFYLARQPDMWRKLRAEISTVPPEELSQAKLKGFGYLQAIIKEALRLHPGLASNIRTALQDTILPTGGGCSGQAPIFVKKGTHIKISLYALQRQKDVWGEDAEEFKPERWGTIQPGHWAYLPFGGGPRLCPGYNLGLAQIAYAVVRITQSFQRIENRDAVDEYVDENKIVTVSKNGTKVALFPA